MSPFYVLNNRGEEVEERKEQRDPKYVPKINPRLYE